MTSFFLHRHNPKVRWAISAAVAGLVIVVDPSPIQAQQSPATGQTLYSQGDPTDDEQYLMQKLNRARMDPVGEGQRLAAWLRNDPVGQAVVSYYGTSPDQVAADIAAFPAVMPLAFDPDLLMTARAHSADMAAHNLLTHTGSDGSQPYERVEASGYLGAFAGENAGGESSLDVMHAAYLVDWGVPDLGHRKQSMKGNAMNVVGLGVAIAADGTIWETEDYGGPKLAGSRTGILAFADVPAMLTGAVYRDDNGNGQYDPGEGIAGVTVSMDGGTYYAVTSASGGYSFPLVKTDGSNADGTAPVRMTFADGGDYTGTVTITEYNGNFGNYRGNVEWDATAENDLRSPDPDLPYFGGGKAVTVGAGGVVKLKIFRPSSSDSSQPYAVSFEAKGSAVPGVNYAMLPATITVPAGERTVKVKIATLTGGDSATKLKLKLRGVSYRGTKTVTITP